MIMMMILSMYLDMGMVYSQRRYQHTKIALLVENRKYTNIHFWDSSCFFNLGYGAAFFSRMCVLYGCVCDVCVMCVCVCVCVCACVFAMCV